MLTFINNISILVQIFRKQKVIHPLINNPRKLFRPFTASPPPTSTNSTLSPLQQQASACFHSAITNLEYTQSIKLPSDVMSNRNNHIDSQFLQNSNHQLGKHLEYSAFPHYSQYCSTNLPLSSLSSGPPLRNTNLNFNFSSNRQLFTSSQHGYNSDYGTIISKRTSERPPLSHFRESQAITNEVSKNCEKLCCHSPQQQTQFNNNIEFSPVAFLANNYYLNALSEMAMKCSSPYQRSWYQKYSLSK